MSNLNTNMRVYHRYLGFFLAGIMAVYSISGIILIFRETDFLKSEKTKVQTVATNLDAVDLGKAIKIKELKVLSDTNNIVSFKQGTYNKVSGVAEFKVKELPFVVSKMTNFHKASTKQPLFYLNIFFGLSLFFFVISSFWMFMPQTSIFRKGLIFTLVGVVLTLVLLFI
ncbi:MAG: hypothetical protein CFE25_04750 [Chitinophagaceae bacterium BSSC1]|nr:MAG: hypothetical protein CFE25_04750 [Chitinophagaceae bacterium BSSC1]